MKIGFEINLHVLGFVLGFFYLFIGRTPLQKPTSEWLPTVCAEVSVELAICSCQLLVPKDLLLDTMLMRLHRK